MDNNLAVSTFCEVTGADPNYARNILSTCNWDVEQAIGLHFASTPEEITQRSVSTNNRDDRSTTSPSPAPHSAGENTAIAAPPERIGWLKWFTNGFSSFIFGSSNISFARNFQTTFGNPRVPFTEARALIEAVEEATAQTKLLILFVHSQSNPISAEIARALQNTQLLNEIRSHTVIYGCFAETPEGAQIIQMLHSNAPTLALLAVGDANPRALCIKTNLSTSQSITDFVNAIQENLDHRSASSSSSASGLDGIDRRELIRGLLGRTGITPVVGGNRSTASNPTPAAPVSAESEARRLLLEEQRREYEEAVRAERERLDREAEERRLEAQRLEEERIQRENAELERKRQQENGQSLSVVVASQLDAMLADTTTTASLIRVVLRMANGSRASLKLRDDTSCSFLYDWVSVLKYLPDDAKYHGGLKERVEQGNVEIRIAMPPKLVENSDQTLKQQGVEDGCALMIVPIRN